MKGRSRTSDLIGIAGLLLVGAAFAAAIAWIRGDSPETGFLAAIVYVPALAGCVIGGGLVGARIGRGDGTTPAVIGAAVGLFAVFPIIGAIIRRMLVCPVTLASGYNQL